MLQRKLVQYGLDTGGQSLIAKLGSVLQRFNLQKKGDAIIASPLCFFDAFSGA